MMVETTDLELLKWVPFGMLFGQMKWAEYLSGGEGLENRIWD